MFDYMYLYDFVSLSRLDSYKTEDKEVFQEIIDDSGGKMDTKHLIMYLCGKPFFQFTPMKVQSPIAYYDDESCKNMRDRGLMYLVDNGTCTQSFKTGIFNVESAEVTLEDGSTTLDGGSWDLKFKSLQKCAKDPSKKFTIDINGICEKPSTRDPKTSPIIESTFSDCEISLKYKSYYACPKKLPIGLLQWIADIFGAILIIWGLLLCFIGTKLVVFIVSMTIGQAAGLIFFYFAYYQFSLQSEENEG